MGIIRGVLQEELDNSQKVLARYQAEVDKVKGSLVKKKIGKKYYYYLAKREGGKVRFMYAGAVSAAIKQKWELDHKKLLDYKSSIKKAKDQIKFLRRALRGKEAV